MTKSTYNLIKSVLTKESPIPIRFSNLSDLVEWLEEYKEDLAKEEIDVQARLDLRLVVGEGRIVKEGN